MPPPLEKIYFSSTFFNLSLASPVYVFKDAKLTLKIRSGGSPLSKKL